VFFPWVFGRAMGSRSGNFRGRPFRGDGRLFERPSPFFGDLARRFGMARLNYWLLRPALFFIGGLAYSGLFPYRAFVRPLVGLVTFDGGTSLPFCALQRLFFRAFLLAAPQLLLRTSLTLFRAMRSPRFVPAFGAVSVTFSCRSARWLTAFSPYSQIQLEFAVFFVGLTAF